MSLDLGGLTASAQARVSKIKKPIQPDPKVDVLESVTIVVAVVCLSLAAEYLVTSFFSLLGFGAQDDDQPWTLAASHEQFVLMNATMHSLNMTASVLQQNVSDLLREKEALQQVRLTSKIPRWQSAACIPAGIFFWRELTDFHCFQRCVTIFLLMVVDDGG